MEMGRGGGGGGMGTKCCYDFYHVSVILMTVSLIFDIAYEHSSYCVLHLLYIICYGLPVEAYSW